MVRPLPEAVFDLATVATPVSLLLGLAYYIGVILYDKKNHNWGGSVLGVEEIPNDPDLVLVKMKRGEVAKYIRYTRKNLS